MKLRRPAAVSLTAALLLILSGVDASAQGGATATSLSGVVVDSSGGVLPGADVTVKNNGTGFVYTAVTSENGSFTVPALPPGSYAVTVALMGFKTWVAPEVVLAAAIPGSVRAVLELGTLEETVIVEGGAEIVQTTTAAVATTLNVKQVTNLPLNSRSALDFIAFLPGVDTASTVRNSTVMGLPQSAINITIDGMNVQDNYLKTSDGFFTRVTPRLDAVEEVTFTSAAQGADAGGQGAVQIRFATRSGTNEYRGSGYYYYRSDALNANTWFNERDNIPKAELVQHQPGARFGGPIVIPKVFDGHNRAFFFVNYEEFYQPRKITDNRTILTTLAQQGIFQYNTSAGVRTVDLLALAASRGQISTIDPLVGQLLADIRASTATTGTITALTNPAVERFTFQQDQKSHNRYPTVRFDVNATQNHRVSFSSNYQHIMSDPDTTNSRQQRFPGFPYKGIQDSTRFTWQTSVRSTLGRSLVNEVRVGGTGGATQFNPNVTVDMWSNAGLANEGGYSLNINRALGITNASSSTTPSSREASTFIIENTLNWLKGAHSMSLGGQWTRADVWLKNQRLVPTMDFEILSGHPALSMFSTSNFPGISSSDLTNARRLYAVLTGNVSTITREARRDESTGNYVVLGPSRQLGRMDDVGFFAQDSWRLRKDLTVNLGLRYGFQLPFRSLNDSYSTATVADVLGITGVGPDFVPGALVTNLGNLFQPGVMTGASPTFKQLAKGVKTYNTDWNNWAPSVGVAWTPHAESGFLARLLGNEGDTVVRGGWTTAYQRNGMSDYTGRFGANPGILITANRSLSDGNLGTLPLLLREPDRLGPPPVPDAPAYPMSPPSVTNSVNIFDPDLEVPYSRTWSAGIQRAISRDTVIEVRYNGSRSYEGWTTYNYNEVNITTNGFLDEFKLAQQNLQANIAAGRGNNFRYYGPGTGTHPLPIYLAFFSGISPSEAGNPARYSSSSFASSTFYNLLAMRNPSPQTAAGTGSSGLMGSSTRRENAIRAGLPANFFLANPDLLGGANITSNGGFTKYHGATVELRRRMNAGLQFQVSYSYGISHDSNRYSFLVPRLTTRQTGAEGGIEHALKGNWVYELPWGKGRRYLSDMNPVLDRILGGWNLFGTFRIQSGRLLDFGNIRLVGMSEREFMDLFKLRIDAGQRVWMLPQDVIDESVKAFSVSATSPDGYSSLGAPSGRYIAPANGPDCIESISGYGNCGLRTLVVTGPVRSRFDFTLSKQVPIKGKVNFEFQAQILNVFNKVNFTPVTGTGSDPDDYEVTGLADVGREMQLVFRINF